MPHNCSAPGCKNNSIQNYQLSFFRFPKQLLRCKQWIAVLKCPTIISYTPEMCYNKLRLCSDHFDNNAFSSMQRNRLKRNAVPTKFCNDADRIYKMETSSGTLADETPSASTNIHLTSAFEVVKPITSSKLLDRCTQTSSRLSYGTPRKLQLKSKTKTLRRQLSPKKKVNSSPITREKIDKFLEENLSPQVASFVNTQLNLMSTKSKGSRYTNEFKQFAQTIYFTSPQAYKFLSNTFHLPSKSTLFRITRK